MKTDKSIMKRVVGLTLLVSLALNPITVMANELNNDNAVTMENIKLSPFNLEGIDKATNKKIEKEVTLKVKTHPKFADWGEEEHLVKSLNGIFDFSVVEDKGNLYTVEIEGDSELILANVKKDEDNLYILKFDEVNKKMKTSNLKGDETELTNIVFEKKATAPDKEKEIIDDIEIVFEDDNKIPDGVNFITFNKENKDMAEYVTANGKLSNVKAKSGDRMKLGLSPEATDKYILKTNNGYENFVWFKVDEKGKAKLYNEVTNEVLDETLDKIVVVKKADLIGEKPQGKEKVKKVLEIFDSNTKKQVINDNVKFLVMGGGETREILSKNGAVELELYKNTKYTITLIRTIENSYKMSGFKFTVNDDGVIEDEDKQVVDKLKVYQGSYLVRLYVIHGGKHLKKSIKFKIEEVGGEVQIRENQNNFLNFDAKIGRKYKITMNEKDDEYYLEKPLEFTMEKYEEDGLYWPRVPEGDKSQGENRKVKAVFLKRYDGVDNHIIGIDEGSTTPCPDCKDNVCEISKVKVNTLPISVKLPEGADKNDVKFKLFNSSKQQYEGEFTIDENEKLPTLELYEKNSYFLQIVSDKYFMHNKHFEAAGEGKLPFAFKDNAELKELVVVKNTANAKNDGTYEITIKFVKDGKALANEEIQFIGTIHSAKATTDETGYLKIRLMEDVTYVAKPSNENLIIDTFPMVVKDKTEWGKEGVKYIFDHSSCGSAEVIKVKNKIEGRTGGSITCKPGNTTIKGMDFKDLFLVTDHLDKANYPQLKGKDFMLLDLVLINHVRQNCERTKLAYGEFEILRKLPLEKKVVSVYYLNGDTKEELKFVQNENIVKITGVNSIGVYPLVIEFENKGLDLPDDKDENKDKKVVLVDDKTKISVSGLEKNLKDLKLNVEVLDASKFEALKGKDVDLYDILFSKAGNAVEVEKGKYFVTVPKRDGKTVEAVYYVDENGKLESLDFEQDGKELNFETSHFSKYAIAYKVGTTAKDDNNKADNNKAETKKSKLAKTGVGANLIELSTLALGSLVGIYVSKKKRK